MEVLKMEVLKVGVLNAGGPSRANHLSLMADRKLSP